MPEIPKWISGPVRFCGGWTSVMSGGISIPLGLFGLFRRDSPQTSFVLLAFVGLLYFAIKTAWTSYETTSKHADELGEKRALHVKEMAQLHQDLKVKEAENQNLKSEMQKLKNELDEIKVTVTGQVVVQNRVRLQILLKVSAVNLGKRPVKIAKAAAILTKRSLLPPPGSSREQAEAFAKLNETNLVSHEFMLFEVPGQDALELSADGGAHDWEIPIPPLLEFLNENHGGEKCGKGYLMLTSGKKVDFIFPLLDKWPPIGN